MEIRSLEEVPIDRLHRAFIAAFSDYVEPVSLSVSLLEHMLTRRGYRGDLSFGAFVDDEIVGFTLNGLGEWHGTQAAYDTGTGVRPGYRGQGIATRIFEASLPAFRSQGVRQYLLEVIRTNTGAARLYRKLGFQVTREFDYWTGPPEIALVPGTPLPDGMSVDKIRLPHWDALGHFWDFQPSWQNSTASVDRTLSRFLVLGVFDGGRVVAYACMERETGDVPQFAVHPDYRRRGLASSLLRQLVKRVRPPELRFTNTEAGSEPTRRFLLGLGLEPGDGQFEMVLDL